MSRSDNSQLPTQSIGVASAISQTAEQPAQVPHQEAIPKSVSSMTLGIFSNKTAPPKNGIAFTETISREALYASLRHNKLTVLTAVGGNEYVVLEMVDPELPKPLI